MSGVPVSLEHSFYPLVWLRIPISAHLSVTLGLKRLVTQFLMTTRSDGDPSHVLTECSHSTVFISTDHATAQRLAPEHCENRSLSLQALDSWAV